MDYLMKSSFQINYQNRIQKLILYPLLAFMSVGLGGCIATAPTKDQPSTKSFALRNYTPTPEQLQKLNNIKLRYEQNGRVDLGIASLIDDVPAAAEFLEKTRISVDNNYQTHLRERAHRTLIQDGRFDPYLDKYWQGVIHQTAPPNWYELDFAYAASVWHAEKNNSPKEQERLTLYSLRACPGHVVRNTRSLNGISREVRPLGGILDKCEERKNDVLNWLGIYLKNDRVNAHDKPDLVIKVANYYFDNSKFDVAAGFYTLFLQLHSVDNANILFKDLGSSMEIREKMGIGEPIDKILKTVAQNQFKERTQNVTLALKRLQLIKDAGIKVIPPYENR